MSTDPPDLVVLDSSVVIKWFRRYEELREKALALRQAHLDGHLRISVPDLLIYEIANVLRYKPDIDKTQVQKAVQSLFDMGIEIYSIGPEVMRTAVQIAYSCDTTVYDAIFAALAEKREAHFITSDGKLLHKLHDKPYVCHLANTT